MLMALGGPNSSADADDNVDIDNISARALRVQTISKISVYLNPMKVLPTDDGIPRDWRGLAQLAGLDGNIAMSLGFKSDPTSEVLKLWINSKSDGVSIRLLRSFLRQMDRWDVVDDTASMIDQDIKEYSKRMESNDVSDRQLTVESDKHILTVDDVCRIEKGLQPQNYDAFLLFAEEDLDFAMQIVDKMEKEYGLKLCLKDRDLVGGLTFQHEAIMKLIAERCNRLIVVVSPNFLRSEANKFFVTFAQALGIEQRQRKVVPCLYQRCQLPPELSYYFLLDFNRAGKLWNIWEKLRDSIQAPSNNRALQETRPWITKTSGAETIPNVISPSIGSSQIYPLSMQQDPPPPYSSHDMTACNFDESIQSNRPEYLSAGKTNWKQISHSASESNLVTHFHISESSSMTERHGSEMDVHKHSVAGKDKGKPFRWLKKLIPREGKRKKHKKKALCN